MKVIKIKINGTSMNEDEKITEIGKAIKKAFEEEMTDKKEENSSDKILEEIRKQLITNTKLLRDNIDKAIRNVLPEILKIFQKEEEMLKDIFE